MNCDKTCYKCPFTLLYNQLNPPLELLLTPFIELAIYMVLGKLSQQ